MALFTKAQLLAELDAKLLDNDTGAITPTVHKALLRDIIDSSAVGSGSAVRSRLQWHPVDGWVPVSEVATQYLVVTRSDAFNTLQAALVAHLTAGGNENYLAGVPAFVSVRTTSYVSIGGIATSGNDGPLADLWPLAGDPPFVWFVTPSPYARLERSRANVSTRQDNAGTNTELEAMVSFGRLPYEITIDDAEYEVGRYRTQLDRPVDDVATPNEAAWRVQYRYAPAPAEVPVVEKVT